MTTTAAEPTDEDGRALARAEELEGEGRHREAIELLTTTNRRRAHPSLERRLVELRHRAFPGLAREPGFARWPAPTSGPPTAGGPVGLPEVGPDQLEAEGIRAHIGDRGSVLVRGLLDPGPVHELVAGIDEAVRVRALGRDAPEARSTAWFNALRLPREQGQSLGRNWVGASGGVLALDSPTNLFRLLEAYEAVGLREVVAGYLGETPVLGANKTTLRRVPLDAHADWHQDGAFLGAGIRALNVWVALSDCGIDAPGLDVVPRRFREVQETGTGGAIFDWAVGPEVVDRLASEDPVVRPSFRAGDALLFDDLCLHRTALDPAMTRPRYAIESWFFAPSAYPDGQVPIVW